MRIKHYLLIAILVITCSEAWGQVNGYARLWRPELTLRSLSCVHNSEQAVALGVRVDDWRTFGLSVGRRQFVHPDPYRTTSVTPAVFMRRYFHLGPRERLSFYVDGFLGADIITSVDSDEGVTPGCQEGDARFMGRLDAGMRLRLFRNLHVFAGPTCGTDYLGFHVGLGL